MGMRDGHENFERSRAECRSDHVAMQLARQERVREQIVEQMVVFLVLHVKEPIVEVVKTISQEPMVDRIDEQLVDVTVPQLLEESSWMKQ